MKISLKKIIEQNNCLKWLFSKKLTKKKKLRNTVSQSAVTRAPFLLVISLPGNFFPWIPAQSNLSKICKVAFHSDISLSIYFSSHH